MNSAKIQLRDTNKKVKIVDVKTYEQFLALIRKTFSGLPEGIIFYYYDSDNDMMVIDSDVPFESYLSDYLGQKEKPKIIIKIPDEDFLNQSFFQKSKNDSQILPKEITEDQTNPPQNKPEGTFKKSSKVNNQLTKALNTVQNKSSKKSKPAEVKTEAQAIAVPKIQQKINKTVHKNIKCSHCKSEVVGIRWKCLDEFDTDVCNRCFEAKVHKPHHTMLKAQTEDYIQKLNYRQSISKLFNPQHTENPEDKSVKPWIKEEDIIQSTPEAVKHIWDASAGLAKVVARDFDDWEKEWEAKNKK